MDTMSIDEEADYRTHIEEAIRHLDAAIELSAEYRQYMDEAKVMGTMQDDLDRYVLGCLDARRKGESDFQIPDYYWQDIVDSN